MKACSRKGLLPPLVTHDLLYGGYVHLGHQLFQPVLHTGAARHTEGRCLRGEGKHRSKAQLPREEGSEADGLAEIQAGPGHEVEHQVLSSVQEVTSSPRSRSRSTPTTGSSAYFLAISLS